MGLFPKHLAGCTFGARVSCPLAAGGRATGQIVFARGRLDDPMLGIRLDGDPKTIVPARASDCAVAGDPPAVAP